MILAVYIFLGGILSFATGREPGAVLPGDLLRELLPLVIVICTFLLSYSLWDVMTVGVVKQQSKFLECRYNDLQITEQVYLAQRVQTNQLEQLPLFLIGSIGCGILVNGRVAAILALLWTILRRMYASTYRAGVGKTMEEMALARFTLPAYFISNSMLTATMIHAFRSLLSEYN